MVKISYRPDIDGLRAIAVLAVVIYHAFPGRLPGGFVGVDIFFVISGYFDVAAATKPLLHLWSLGVEEQFYLFWPLLLVTCYRRRRNLLAPILIVTVASFVCNIATVRAHPSAAFYLPMARMWELGFGALLAHRAPKMLEWRSASAPLSWIELRLAAQDIH